MFKPWFIDAINYLWEQRKQLPEVFDYPDYAGMPPKTAKILSGDFVDVVQYFWDDKSPNRLGKFKNKKHLIREILGHHAWNPTEAFDLDAALKAWPD